MEARRPTFQQQLSRQTFAAPGRTVALGWARQDAMADRASPARSHRGCWAGIGVWAASVVIGYILFRTARRDRLARRQFARYDGPLDDLLEPK